MQKIYDVTGKRELFIDEFLIEKKYNLSLKPHFPTELPGTPEKPNGHYVTLLRSPREYLLYYRGMDSVYKGSTYNNNPGEFVGIARSSDGISWQLPELDLFPGKPVPANALLYGEDVITHNFVPFYDTAPDCPPEKRFKAVAGVRETGGLYAFYSADGIRWEQFRKEPVIPYEPEKTGGHMLDSQNVLFYSETEKCYVMYIRVWKTADGLTGVRSFAKVTSRDFLNWSEPEFLKVNQKNEHLYVSGLAPYPRAPHIYLGAATRYFENRGSATDVTMLFSRQGKGIARPCPGAWIKPGLDGERWLNRMNYIAWGIVDNGGAELFMHHGRRNLIYKFRTDGFVSLSASLKTGSFMTRCLSRQRGGLELNLSTSAGGYIQLEVCDEKGIPFPGYSFKEMEPFWGDSLCWSPRWKGEKSFSEVPPGNFRLRVRMKECDLFSINFPE